MGNFANVKAQVFSTRGRRVRWNKQVFVPLIFYFFFKKEIMRRDSKANETYRNQSLSHSMRQKDTRFASDAPILNLQLCHTHTHMDDSRISSHFQTVPSRLYAEDSPSREDRGECELQEILHKMKGIFPPKKKRTCSSLCRHNTNGFQKLLSQFQHCEPAPSKMSCFLNNTHTHMFNVSGNVEIILHKGLRDSPSTAPRPFKVAKHFKDDRSHLKASKTTRELFEK